MIETGTVVDGRYKILGELGRGGMSIVYLALNEHANKTWAIKAIKKKGIMDTGPIGQDLIEEADILKHLHHRYLPVFEEVIEEEEYLLIVMEYIRGRSLREILEENLSKNGKPLAVADVMLWARQLCEVLQYLHSRPEPVIYQDLKPSNVMVRPDGDIVLIDFGTARLFKKECRKDTICFGTPGFAAPEQYGGCGRTGPWTDIYCLGATLHYLLTGRHPAEQPFYFQYILECRPQLMEETPAEWQRPLQGLEIIIYRCTRYSISERYQSCEELGRELELSDRPGGGSCRMLMRRMGIFLVCMGAVFVSGFMTVYGLYMEKYMRARGYDYYLEMGATAGYDEKIEFYRKAVALEPSRAEAYLALLEALLEDYLFSEDELMLVTGILYSREEGYSQDNRTCLQGNEGGYIIFSYQMGLACYYLSEEGGDKGRAAPWFRNVADADMEHLNLGEFEHMKEVWQARAGILERISSYYGYRIGPLDCMRGEAAYRDYWEDMVSLMAEELTDRDNAVMELKLYQEIVMQILDRASEFREEAGIRQSEMEAVLDEIVLRVNRMDSPGHQVRELKNNIVQAAEKARRTAASVYGGK